MVEICQVEWGSKSWKLLLLGNSYSPQEYKGSYETYFRHNPKSPSRFIEQVMHPTMLTLQMAPQKKKKISACKLCFTNPFFLYIIYTSHGAQKPIAKRGAPRKQDGPLFHTNDRVGRSNMHAKQANSSQYKPFSNACLSTWPQDNAPKLTRHECPVSGQLGLSYDQQEH
ncbi:unnamed protein product [Ixodes pacificus]